MLIKKVVKVIIAPPQVKKEIAAELGCSRETVYNALNLTDPTTGEQADRIRSMALQRGGCQGTKVKWVSIDVA